MLEYRKKQLLKKYGNYSLKVDPFILNSSGYNPQETLIKINNQIIYCTPITLTLKKCSLLLSLNREEGQQFQQFKDTLISLNFSFGDVHFDKPVSFYLRGTLDSLKNIRDKVYVLEFTQKNVSETFIEIFLIMSDKLNSYLDLYKGNPKIDQSKCITDRTFKIAAIYTNHSLVASGHVKHMDLTTIVVKVDKNIFEKDQIYNIQSNFYTKRIKLVGKVFEINGDEVVFNISYKTEFVYILSNFLINGEVEDSIEEL